MNPNLDRLKPYPFQSLATLLAGAKANSALAPINLSIGEPKHATPEFIRAALVEHLQGLSSYPLTLGSAPLRAAIADWLSRRFKLPAVDPARQVLPVNGSREALFSFAQAVVDPTRPGAVVVAPNPFYQIYEGAALLAGAEPQLINTLPENLFALDFGQLPDRVWARTQLVYVCSPGNPSGAVMPLTEWERLFALADEFGFVIASDECYSEIYLDAPPLGGLEAAAKLGRSDFRRLIAFTSLSKRSSVPGLRSGFVAGDAELIKAFTLYRTYHGSAMSPVVQQASIAAWNDEAHVVENRAAYRAKFEAMLPLLADVLDVRAPDAGFYLWAGVPGGDDVGFTKALLAQSNVQVLPGSLLAREANGVNPGAGRIRMALVAEIEACVTAAQRIRSFCLSTP